MPKACQELVFGWEKVIEREKKKQWNLTCFTLGT